MLPSAGTSRHSLFQEVTGVNGSSASNFCQVFAYFLAPAPVKSMVTSVPLVL